MTILIAGKQICLGTDDFLIVLHESCVLVLLHIRTFNMGMLHDAVSLFLFSQHITHIKEPEQAACRVSDIQEP